MLLLPLDYCFVSFYMRLLNANLAFIMTQFERIGREKYVYLKGFVTSLRMYMYVGIGVTFMLRFKSILVES